MLTITKFRERKSLLTKYMRPSYKTKDWEDKKELEGTIQKMVDFNCDIDLFNNLWENPEYGPIIASCCLLGCVEDNIPMRSLMSTWIRFKKNTVKNNFIGVYNKSSTDYDYCPKAWNFLVQFYEKGLCNCECGVYLALQLNINFPSKKYSNVCMVILPKHAKVSFVDLRDRSSMYFESTKRKKRPMEDFDNVKYNIVSEQLIALQMIFKSSCQRNQTYDNVELYKKIFFNMFKILPDEIEMGKMDVFLTTVKRPTTTC